PPGGTTVKLDVARFPQLRVQRPRLWWPNGYGAPELYTLHLAFRTGGAESDRKAVRFGIREVSYELSLFDAEGRLRRVEYSPAREPGRRVVDVRHEAIRKAPGGWAQSLLPGAEASPALRPLHDTRLAPYLALRVNGVRIAVKGGNWGTDDWRKRSSRERLEPYFRLQRDAHMNVIRNWVGQSTNPSLYELADEYGMLVFNDFWASTQNYNQSRPTRRCSWPTRPTWSAATAATRRSCCGSAATRACRRHCSTRAWTSWSRAWTAPACTWAAPTRSTCRAAARTTTASRRSTSPRWPRGSRSRSARPRS